MTNEHTHIGNNCLYFFLFLIPESRPNSIGTNFVIHVVSDKHTRTLRSSYVVTLAPICMYVFIYRHIIMQRKKSRGNWTYRVLGGHSQLLFVSLYNYRHRYYYYYS